MPASKPADHTILLIEDEPDVRDLLRLNLRKAGFNVIEADDGVKGLSLARRKLPDAIVLDLMLPQLRGEDVCREIRARPATAAIPVLMLTAKAQPGDRVKGLELGADDYVTKPFSPREVVLRLQALLRRARASGPRESRKVGPFEIDRGNFEVRLDGEKLQLTPLEFKLLIALLERRGRVLTRETLLRDVWGYRNAHSSRTVDTHVRRLRGKLGGHGKRLETVHGEGYLLRPEEKD
jgi:two-component system phosphate regulon response regulator PhoB